MTQRKEEVLNPSTTANSFNIYPFDTKNCWWSDEVLSPADATSSELYEDFVLISEFSELEGPLPLAIVSNSTYIDLKHYTEEHHLNPKSIVEELTKIGLELFDFNAFVLRVVSVDRSSEYEQIDPEFLEPVTPSSIFADSAPCSFSIPDDTQVYFTDSEHKFFAFTHHLTLFDINARGYVHPVALSYITRDPHKIVIRFEELMEQFNEVSIKMKKGNYSNFTLDLKRRLLDLQYTEISVSNQQKPALSKQAIQQAVTATKLMIDTLESSTSQMNPTDKPVKEEEKETVDASPKDYTPKCIDSLYPVPHFEKKLRSLAQLCQEPTEEESKKRPSLTHKTATMIPLVFSIIESQQQHENARPTFAHAIKHDMYSEAIDSIQDMTRHLGKSSVILDVDEEEQSFVEPLSSAMAFGRTFMMNMDNPQPREDERENIEVGSNSKDEPFAFEEKNDSYQKEIKYHHKSSTDTEDEKELFYPVQLAATKLWKSNHDTSSIHLLEVLKQYQSLIVDVIFSLLTGRTVLIQGSANNKDNVKKIVHALSVFVPGQRRDKHQIIDWFGTSRLTDSEIGSIKLVGIDKENMDASIHIEGSCVLDIDVKKGSLNSSPVYVEGQWINQLLDRIMLFSSDESYLAYLHTVFMTMSLKAFVYHHLYVCDEFKLDDLSSASTTTTTTTTTNKGYASETNSESSTLSRKWSVRLMSYLKKHEDQENEQQQQISRPPSRSSSIASKHTVTEDEEEDFSEENQATVTLQNLMKNNNQQEKPRTIVGLFGGGGGGGGTTSVEPVTTTTTVSAATTPPDERRSSVSTRRDSTDSSDISSGNLSEEDVYDMRRALTHDGSFLNFGAEDLDYFDVVQQQEDSSSEEEEKPTETQRRRRYKGKNRKLSDVGPDGVSFTERRGRRYLQEKLKVYGDDQTIVVYLATCVL